jgi:hypothetical protein
VIRAVDITGGIGYRLSDPGNPKILLGNTRIPVQGPTGN